MFRNERLQFVVEGIQSFIKGCSAVTFVEEETFYSYLEQFSENPSVYTKISCFLPWIAAQYNMEYTASGDPAPDCQAGNGDITEVTAKVCRTNPQLSILDYNDGIEAPCLFPFTLNGQSYNSCFTDEIEDFTRPVFRCPIRTIKGLGTDYTDEHLSGGEYSLGFFCPTNVINVKATETGQIEYVFNSDGPVYGPNGELELDPDNDDGCQVFFLSRPAFATCKNNCPGVNFPVVSGGFALLVGTAAHLAGLGGAGGGVAAVGAALGGGGLVTGLVPLAAAGALGVLGVSSAMCLGPAYCTLPGGQCCLLIVDADRGSLICPISC